MPESRVHIVVKKWNEYDEGGGAPGYVGACEAPMAQTACGQTFRTGPWVYNDPKLAKPFDLQQELKSLSEYRLEEMCENCRKAVVCIKVL